MTLSVHIVGLISPFSIELIWLREISAPYESSRIEMLLFIRMSLSLLPRSFKYFLSLILVMWLKSQNLCKLAALHIVHCFAVQNVSIFSITDIKKLPFVRGIGRACDLSIALSLSVEEIFRFLYERFILLIFLIMLHKGFPPILKAWQRRVLFCIPLL